MEFLSSIPAIVWLLISAAFFAGGELFSKTWANSPTLIEIILLLVFYTISTLLWLPALFNKNQLAITGTLWLLLGTVATIALGLLVFREKITPVQALGILLALIAIVLLNLPVKNKEVCINENCFKIEIAKTQEERMKGLMNRDKLPKDAGMLFVFDTEGIYSFWMKNTLIPLDIIWIDGNKKIVYIAENAPPCPENCKPYLPTSKAKYILEINGGLADKLNIKAGDTVKMPEGY